MRYFRIKGFGNSALEIHAISIHCCLELRRAQSQAVLQFNV